MEDEWKAEWRTRRYGMVSFTGMEGRPSARDTLTLNQLNYKIEIFQFHRQLFLPEEHDVPGVAPLDHGGDVQLAVVGGRALADHHLQQDVPGEERRLALGGRRRRRKGGLNM